MSEIETYVSRAIQLIDGLVSGYDSHKLFDEFGIISTNPNDPEENGDASIVLTYGGPTVYLTVGGDAVNFHYSFGEETDVRIIADGQDEIDALRRFAEETAS